MDENFLTDLLSVSSERELETIIAANSFTADPANWLRVERPFFDVTAIHALAIAIQEATKSVISKRCRDLSFDNALLNGEPSAIRNALYPEATNWTSYAAIHQMASKVHLSADGDRFKTNR